MKRKIFIGSSEEGLAIAEQVEKRFLANCGDWLLPVKWTDNNAFTFNHSTMQCLLNNAHKYEYGIFIATSDDLIKKRGISNMSMRDNVLFELGLFLGSLGFTRTYLLADKETGLPSDFAGTTIAIYDKLCLEKKIDKIIEAIEKTKQTFNFRIIPSTALAFGYYNNYLIPLAHDIREKNIKIKVKIKIPTKIFDLNNKIKREIRLTKSKNVCFNDSGRPTIYVHSKDNYWDMPTNLITLDEIIQKLFPRQEIGHNKEYQEIIEHELLNFYGTINSLVEDDILTKELFTIEYLD